MGEGGVSCIIHVVGVIFPAYILNRTEIHYLLFLFPATVVSTPKITREKLGKKKPTWEDRTKALLTKELKTEHKRYRELMKRNTAQCNLIR